ncbi:MAG: prolyl oligopeptidase family serine peptidase [Anaerolineae bacterium]|nr:prolyl oligopeptidase family serine peptidase [Anaerolineae bacterium]
MIKKTCLVVMLVVLAAAFVWSPVPVQAQGGSTHDLVYDGLERTYTVYAPSTSSDGDELMPLVIALHPFAGSGKGMAAITGFDAVAEREGFIVAYPDSSDLHWDDGRLATGWPMDLDEVDDVGFIATMIDTIETDYPVDPARVYLAGFVSGGLMAYRLACEMPERFAKVAVLDALTWEYHVNACPADSDPLSMLVLLGEQAVEIPAGGEVYDADDGTGLQLTMLSADDTAAFWAERSGCDPDAVERSETGDFIRYGTCAENTTVTFQTLPDVSTNWPRVGDYVLNQAGLDATEAITEFFFSDEDTSDRLATYEPQGDLYGGAARSAIVYVPPSYDPDQPMPVVIVLHGRPGTASGIAYLYDLNRVASKNGFIAVYPDGMPVDAGPEFIGREWNYMLGASGYEYLEADDVDYLIKLVDDLAVDLNIDRQRQYVTGFSNGGFMTLRMACDANDHFAAFGVAGAALPVEFLDLCDEAPAVPILFMHGTEDKSIPWEGLIYGDLIAAVSVPDTALYWAIHNKCDPQAIDYTILPSLVENPTTEVHRYEFTECADNANVLFYVVDGGGHSLPGTLDRLDPAIAGEVNMDMHAGEAIWEFLSRYTLDGTG